MKVFPEKTIIYLLSAVLMVTACGGESSDSAANGTNQNTVVNENANVAKDDAAELSRIINLPFEPDESAVWRETELNPNSANERIPGPTDRKLVAVLKFTPEQTTEIIKRAETYRPSVPAALEAESWFPPELTAQSQASGDETIKGNSYAANDFLKTPYTDGKLTRIVNTDYFVLELTAF